jgi:adenylate kinase
MVAIDREGMPEDSFAALEAQATYAEQHGVFQLFEGLLQDLLIHKPDDPIAHLIGALGQTAVPRVIVFGGPSTDTTFQCKGIASSHSLVHVDADNLWLEASAAGAETGLAAKALKDAGDDIPSDMTRRLVMEKLASPECSSRGWVLEGFPTTASDAHAMLTSGLLPTRVIEIAVSDAEAKRRLVGRRIDPVGNAVYHVHQAMSTDPEVLARLVHRAEDAEERVMQRLLSYRYAAGPTLAAFAHTLVTVNGAQSNDAIAADIALTITSTMSSRAPRGAPRVLLLGGPGAGADELADGIEQRYGAIAVSAARLLKAAASKDTALGKKMLPFTAGEIWDVPTEMLAPLVLERLKGKDVRRKGFVLTGFPSNVQQAKALKNAGVWIRQAVLLDIGAKEAARKLVEARFDPVTGEQYHPDGSWPKDLNVEARLVQHPRYAAAAVEAALASWEERKVKLLAAYPDLLTEDATRPALALEERLQPYF